MFSGWAFPYDAEGKSETTNNRLLMSCRSESEMDAEATPAGWANTYSEMHPLRDPPHHPHHITLMCVVLIKPF